MSCCITPILNGSSVGTEGARLQKTRSVCTIPIGPVRGNVKCCLTYTPLQYISSGITVQAPITPTSDSLLATKYAVNTAPTQDRIRMLLATTVSNYRSEGTRIDDLIKNQLLCNSNATIFTPRINTTIPCHVSPPPPAPQAKIQCGFIMQT